MHSPHRVGSVWQPLIAKGKKREVGLTARNPLLTGDCLLKVDPSGLSTAVLESKSSGQTFFPRCAQDWAGLEAVGQGGMVAVSTESPFSVPRTSLMVSTHLGGCCYCPVP